MGKIRGFLAIVLAAGACILAPPGLVLAQTAAPPGVSQQAPAALTPEDTLETAYTLGMGTGSRAGATGTSALAYNISNMGAERAYHIEAFSQVIPGDDTYWSIGSSVTDSATSQRIALGTSFRYVFAGTDREYDGIDWRTGIAIKAIEQLSLGFGVRVGDIDSKTFDGQRIGPSFNGITVDASLTLTPLRFIKIAGLGYNLVRTHSPLAPQVAGGSISVTPVDSFTAGFDILADLTTFESTELLLGGGAQFVAAEKVPLRIGYRRDNGRRLNQITAGTGFTQGKFGIEASIRQTLGSQRETYIVIVSRFVVDQ